MPNKYEREIEEILRNLERTEPRGSGAPRFPGGRATRGPEKRMNTRRRSAPSFQFTFQEWLLVIGVVCALIGGGYAFANQEPTLITGIVAVIGFICLVGVAISSFVSRSRFSARASAGSSVRYGNVTITPLHSNPLRRLATRWHLFMLKLRYRRKKDH
jgi:hypothetical protein